MAAGQATGTGRASSSRCAARHMRAISARWPRSRCRSYGLRAAPWARDSGRSPAGGAQEHDLVALAARAGVRLRKRSVARYDWAGPTGETPAKAAIVRAQAKNEAKGLRYLDSSSCSSPYRRQSVRDAQSFSIIHNLLRLRGNAAGAVVFRAAATGQLPHGRRDECPRRSGIDRRLFGTPSASAVRRCSPRRTKFGDHGGKMSGRFSRSPASSPGP